MAQIALKLPCEVNPRMVNCDLGHSLFMAEGRIKFFCDCGEKTRLCQIRSVREIRAFGLQARKYLKLTRNENVMNFHLIHLLLMLFTILISNFSIFFSCQLWPEILSLQFIWSQILHQILKVETFYMGLYILKYINFGFEINLVCKNRTTRR